MKWVSLALLLVLTRSLLAAEFKPNEIYVAEQSCPFECCRLGKWAALQTSKLFSQPSVKSEVLGTIEKGDSVTALAGETRVLPVLLEVKYQYEQHAPGDQIWLLNYLGEGEYLAWKGGEKIYIALPFSPYQEMAMCDSPTSKSNQQSWVCLTQAYQPSWWVKVLLEDNQQGWLLNPYDFDGMDACGGRNF